MVSGLAGECTAPRWQIGVRSIRRARVRGYAVRVVSHACVSTGQSRCRPLPGMATSSPCAGCSGFRREQQTRLSHWPACGVRRSVASACAHGDKGHVNLDAASPCPGARLHTTPQFSGQGRSVIDCKSPGGKSRFNELAIKHMNAMPQAASAVACAQPRPARQRRNESRKPHRARM